MFFNALRISFYILNLYLHVSATYLLLESDLSSPEKRKNENLERNQIVESNASKGELKLLLKL